MGLATIQANTPFLGADKEQEKELVLTSKELLDRPDLVGIDGVLYNLHAFAPTHPGGTVITTAGAYDGSALFHSMHPGMDPLKRPSLQAHRVGVHQRGEDDTVFTYDSAFAKDMISSVKKAMAESGNSWSAGVGFWSRTALICTLTLVFEWYWATTGLIAWGILVGVMHAQIGLAVQHDGSHGAIGQMNATGAKVNAFFAHGADWIGSCRWIWLQQHVLWHHPYTNVHGKDLDACSAEPAIVFHDYSASSTKSSPPSSPLLQIQGYIANLVLLAYGPSIVYNLTYVQKLAHSDRVPQSVSDGAYMQSKKPLVIALRAWYFVRIVLTPWLYAGQSLFVTAFLPCLVCGAILTFLFVLSHNFEGVDRDPVPAKEGADPVCWYKLQTETGSTYGGYTAMFFTGGLNLQIEHHLFPRMSSWNYPMLRPVVQECCKRHGVEYNYFPTLASNLVSMLKYMNKVGVIAVLQLARED